MSSPYADRLSIYFAPANGKQMDLVDIKFLTLIFSFLSNLTTFLKFKIVSAELERSL